MKTLRNWMLLAGAVLGLTGSGCNPFGMGIATPIPVQPWMIDQVEARLQNLSDHYTTILGPIPPGYRPLCEDIPDRATILRAMPPVPRGIPYVYEEFRDDVDFAVERMVDQIDPPRFFPLVGPAQLHHCHFKCTVYYTETRQSEWPIAFQTKKRRVEVVYIDRDHLHSVACTPEQLQSMTRDMMQIQPQ
jgi:hypothetical protein